VDGGDLGGGEVGARGREGGSPVGGGVGGEGVEGQLERTREFRLARRSMPSLSHTKHYLDGFRKSTPPHNRQLSVLISNSPVLAFSVCLP
jgi:hypothetical protein